MRANRKVEVLAMVWMAGWCGVALAAPIPTVSWTLGQTPPAAWTINPPAPGTTQTITFSGPTRVYSNECVGEVEMGGNPVLAVDTINKVVQLQFQGPAPSMCALILMPVCGLQGQFGPLAAGRWTFKGTTDKGAFEIRFTVGPAKVIYADADSPSSSPTGTSWSKAYKTLQDAMAVAWSGDEIWVAEGTYKPDLGSAMWYGDRAASFELAGGVKVKGGYAGYGMPNPNARDVSAYPTILSGDLNGDDLWGILNKGDNSYRVVTATATFPQATLDGFTIAGGQADGPYPYQYGGGLYVAPGSALAVSHCILSGNTAVFGGGLACLGGSVSMGSCTLSGNRALLLGGGAYAQDGEVHLVDVLVVGNSAGMEEAMGGSAIQAINASLSLDDCTVADNVSTQGKAIAAFVWGSPVADTIRVTNSILYNGGTEISSNDTSIVTVAYSDVKGGWSGTGNVNTDPHFVDPGQWSIEGQWMDGDYHLQGASPCIDKGDKTRLPADGLDLDGDGNTTEALPVDAAAATRVQGSQVDMGAYEQIGSGSDPGYEWEPVKYVGILYDVANPQPGVVTVFGSGALSVHTNYVAELKIEAAAASAAGGTWTAWFSPDPNPVGSGVTTVFYQIQGLGVNTTHLTAGATNVQIATMTIYARPAL